MMPVRLLVAAAFLAAGLGGAFAQGGGAPRAPAAAAPAAEAPAGEAEDGEAPAAGGDLIGTWRLVALQADNPAGRDRRGGERAPQGFLVVTPDRLTSMIASGGGPGPGPHALLTYTGTYAVDGDRLVTKVDLAWNPAWVGRDQTRIFRIDGDRLYLEFVPPNGARPKGAPRTMLVWERAK